MFFLFPPSIIYFYYNLYIINYKDMNFLTGLLGTVGSNLASGLLDKGLKLGKELLSGGK